MTVGKNLQRKKLLAAICQLVEAFNKYYSAEMLSAGRSSQGDHTIFKKKKNCVSKCWLQGKGFKGQGILRWVVVFMKGSVEVWKRKDEVKGG